jgi:hypothetical protein
MASCSSASRTVFLGDGLPIGYFEATAVGLLDCDRVLDGVDAVQVGRVVRVDKDAHGHQDVRVPLSFRVKVWRPAP